MDRFTTGRTFREGARVLSFKNRSEAQKTQARISNQTARHVLSRCSPTRKTQIDGQRL